MMLFRISKIYMSTNHDPKFYHNHFSNSLFSKLVASSINCICQTSGGLDHVPLNYTPSRKSGARFTNMWNIARPDSDVHLILPLVFVTRKLKSTYYMIGYTSILQKLADQMKFLYQYATYIIKGKYNCMANRRRELERRFRFGVCRADYTSESERVK
jgi:hypothetical protein